MNSQPIKEIIDLTFKISIISIFAIGIYQRISITRSKPEQKEIKKTDWELEEEYRNENRPALPKQFIRKDGSYNYKAYFLQAKQNVDIEKHYKFIDYEAMRCNEAILSIAKFGENGIFKDLYTKERIVRRYVIEFTRKFEYSIEFYKYLITLNPQYIFGIHKNLLSNSKFIYEIEDHIIYLKKWSYESKKFYLEQLARLVYENE